MQELAPFSVGAETAIVIMELSTQLGHVVALNMFLFQELVLSVGVRATITKLAFTKVNDVFAHLSLSFHFHSLVEFLSFLDISEQLLLLLSSGLAIGVIFFHSI
jgi:hypothetical protein